MKSNLLFAILSVVFTSPSVLAKSELDTLRSRCTEQEKQIHQLKQENTKLRSGDRETRPTAAKTETNSNSISKTPAPAATPTGQPTGSGYTVKAGDNFDKIARKIGVNPQKLAKANGLTSNSIIRPGQKLKVPDRGTPAATQAVARVSSSESNHGTRSHRVQQGETFSSISRKHGISVDALVAANPKAKPSALRPGQVVNLGSRTTSMISAPKPTAPADKESIPETTPIPKSPTVSQNSPVSKPSLAAPTPAISDTKSTPPASLPAIAAEKEKPPITSPSEKKIHAVTIDGEITYGEFASKHGTDAERLNALNGLDLTTATILAKGSELYVPGQP
jgi:LysM repeat protein